MSLQNKKTHLLNSTDDTGEDEALDLFEKYGGGGDEEYSGDITPDTSSTSISNTQQTSTQNDDSNNTSTVSQKKEWEEKLKGDLDNLKLKQSAQDAFDKEKSDEKNITESDTNKSDKPEPPKAVPPVKKNFNTVVDKVDKEKERAKQVFVEQKQESVYEASATNRGVKSKKEQEIKKSYTGEKDKVPKREIHIDPSKKTILIVDDDIDTLEMYADVFESANYNVLRASDGLEAMALVAKHTPHVVFTGIVMPRMDGFALMDALKQNKRTADIPVVINSHLGRETDKEKAKELGARDFIVRGFTQPREVVERIGAMLLRSEYVFRFDKNDPEARKLAKDLGIPNFYHCPRGQEMVLKLRITDEKDLTFAARFSCMDTPEK